MDICVSWVAFAAEKNHCYQVVFSNQVCLDCGQVGDERLLTDFCHEARTEVDRRYFSSYLPKRPACSHCKNTWSRQVTVCSSHQGSPDLSRPGPGSLELHLWAAVCPHQEHQGRQGGGDRGQQQGGPQHDALQAALLFTQLYS